MDKINLKILKHLVINPGEKLIVIVPKNYSIEQGRYFHALFCEMFGRSNVAVVKDGLKFVVVKKEGNNGQ